MQRLYTPAGQRLHFAEGTPSVANQVRRSRHCDRRRSPSSSEAKGCRMFGREVPKAKRRREWRRVPEAQRSGTSAAEPRGGLLRKQFLAPHSRQASQTLEWHGSPLLSAVLHRKLHKQTSENRKPGYPFRIDLKQPRECHMPPYTWLLQHPRTVHDECCQSRRPAKERLREL